MQPIYFLTAAISITLVSSCGPRGEQGSRTGASMPAYDTTAVMAPVPQESLPKGKKATPTGAPVQGPTHELAPPPGDSGRRM